MHHWSDSWWTKMTAEWRQLVDEFRTTAPTELEYCIQEYIKAYKVCQQGWPGNTPEGGRTVAGALNATKSIPNYWVERMQALIFHAGLDSRSIIDELRNHPEECIRELTVRRLHESYGP